MMKFTLGLAILAFTLIVGSYQYFENEDLILRKEQGLKEAERKRDRYIRIKEASKQIPELSIIRGDDKKNTIERLLKLRDKGMTFSFLGQANRQDAYLGLIRHTYKIEGPATYMEVLEVLDAMDALPGFVNYRVCYGCAASNRKMDDNEHMVNIEGYLYAYDPNIL